MCYYRLYIFLGCGHATTSAKPIGACASVHVHSEQGTRSNEPPLEDSGPGITIESTLSATDVECAPGPSATKSHMAKPRINSAAPSVSDDTPCPTKLLHPFQSLKLYRMCDNCTTYREQRLDAVSTGDEVKYQPWRWRVKYLSTVSQGAIYTECGTMGKSMGNGIQNEDAK
ncbi:hypothetical protein K504DRAFT_458285 [Pleomassaria siparia CBS 279.74]|uniref:Uncharacterized protein n=1 Tax=Pleomassaria siparia CBS 279.74 TaxID=1314801 RepID=A0A6G1K4R3_9PLEO|nr:hypothetical protein K504DRAFT_458285 [Pleomassaria siparia CBS 279.74]